jgi:hypothetical protein
MPGYNGQTLAQNVLNGNNVVVMLGDEPVAFAQTTGHQFPMGTEQLYGIGNAKPQEVQQLRISPAFTLDKFSLTPTGVQLLENGQRLEYSLAGKSYEMHVLDGSANQVIMTYVGAKAQNYSQNIPANAPIRETFSFLALDVLDANGNSIIDDGNNALNIAAAGATAALGASNIGLQT